MSLTGAELVRLLGYFDYPLDARDVYSTSAEIAALPPTAGTTLHRPTSPLVAQPYFDTTLGLPIWWNGTAWINGAGTPV